MSLFTLSLSVLVTSDCQTGFQIGAMSSGSGDKAEETPRPVAGPEGSSAASAIAGEFPLLDKAGFIPTNARAMELFKMPIYTLHGGLSLQTVSIDVAAC